MNITITTPQPTSNITVSPIAVPMQKILLEYPFTSESEVTVTHNLGRMVEVSVWDETGTKIFAEIQQISTNQVKVFFNQPKTGTILIY